MTITTHQIGGPSPFPIIKDFRTDPRATDPTMTARIEAAAQWLCALEKADWDEPFARECYRKLAFDLVSEVDHAARVTRIAAE